MGKQPPTHMEPEPSLAAQVAVGAAGRTWLVLGTLLVLDVVALVTTISASWAIPPPARLRTRPCPR